MWIKLQIKRWIFNHFIQPFIWLEWGKTPVTKAPTFTIRVGKKFITITATYSMKTDEWEFKENYNPAV